MRSHIDWMTQTAYRKQNKAVQRRDEVRSNLSQSEVGSEGVRENIEQNQLRENLINKLFKTPSGESKSSSTLLQTIFREDGQELYESAVGVSRQIEDKLNSMTTEELTQWAIRNETLLDDQFMYTANDGVWSFSNSENIQMINRFQSSLNIRYNRYYTSEEQKEKNRQGVESLRRFQSQSYAMSHMYDEE